MGFRPYFELLCNFSRNNGSLRAIARVSRRSSEQEVVGDNNISE